MKTRAGSPCYDAGGGAWNAPPPVSF